MLTRKINLKSDKHQSFTQDEWLVTNGLGGFSCGTIAGAPTRKHHGLLIAALSSPFGRTMTISYAEETLIFPEKKIPLSFFLDDQKSPAPSIPIVEFKLEMGLPVWRYEIGGVILEKKIRMVYRQNTVHISYRLLSGPSSLLLKWRPFLNFRGYEESVSQENKSESYTVHIHENFYEIEHPDFPRLRFYQDQNAGFVLTNQKLPEIYYRIEEKRGYDYIGSLESPGYFMMDLKLDDACTIVCSTEDWKTIHAVPPKLAPAIENYRRRNLLRKAGTLNTDKELSELVLAADQFIITPSTRKRDIILMQASGEEAKTIIAGYPWFTDWGRDTMISLEGLTLLTGRSREARTILITFGHYIKNGLIPNMFPDGENIGLYHTADASLWFFHAIDRYITLTGDDSILESLYPRLLGIIEHHIEGTLFGIKVEEDGLLTQGEEDYQLTWMDAKVGDWVVTPRRGKAVEINALWYNALSLMDEWSENKESQFQDFAKRCYDSFNKIFWNKEEGCLYDVIESENQKDAAIRPNQLFAISLKYPVLRKNRWESVFEKVKKDLLTPYGLRTLSPYHPDYKAKYDGDLRARDAAYHQGTVWPWLIGPFIDVYLKIHPHNKEEAKDFISQMLAHLGECCIGSISEIFDSTEPFHARGCFAQAWSVAETIRALKGKATDKAF